MQIAVNDSRIVSWFGSVAPMVFKKIMGSWGAASDIRQLTSYIVRHPCTFVRTEVLPWTNGQLSSIT